MQRESRPTLPPLEETTQWKAVSKKLLILYREAPTDQQRAFDPGALLSPLPSNPADSVSQISRIDPFVQEVVTLIGTLAAQNGISFDDTAKGAVKLSLELTLIGSLHRNSPEQLAKAMLLSSQAAFCVKALDDAELKQLIYELVAEDARQKQHAMLDVDDPEMRPRLERMIASVLSHEITFSHRLRC